MSTLYTVTASELWHGGNLYSAGETITLSAKAAKYLAHALRNAALPVDPVEPEASAEAEETPGPAKRARKSTPETGDGDGAA